MQFCCLYHYRYYGQLRLPSNSPPFRYAYKLSFYLKKNFQCWGGSLQFRTILSIHVASLIPKDSSMLFQALYIFHGLHPYAQGSTSSLSLSKKRVLFNDTAEFTNVTTCIFTSTLLSTLPSRFRPNISVTPGDWLLGSLAIT